MNAPRDSAGPDTSAGIGPVPEPVSGPDPRPESLTPSFGRVSLTLLAGQVHVNLLGNVHGGEVMRLVDSTAGAVAQRHSGGPAVTAAMDEMAFLAPVHVGDILRASAQVNWAGKTSMEVGVRVESEPWNQAGTEPVHVASAYLVFVAIDADGRPREIPALAPEDAEEERRMREAEIRRAHRLARKTEIDEGRST
jgi:acyl-CoA hydrolase